MLDLKIPLNIEPAAIGILQEHCNNIMRLSLGAVNNNIRYDLEHPGSRKADKFFTYGSTAEQRKQLMKTCEDVVSSRKTAYFVQVEVLYLFRMALKELTIDFDNLIQMCLDEGNMEKADVMMQNFRIVSDVNRDFIKNALYNSNTWDRKVYHFLHRRNDAKSQYVLKKNDDPNMLRFETPYFFMDLFLTNSMEEILDKKFKDNSIMSTLFMGEEKESAWIIGQL